MTVPPTAFLLIRHGSHSLLGHILCGRTFSVGLDETGRRQSCALAAAIAAEKPSVIYSSPQQRCLETAAPIAEACGSAAEVCETLDEIDFGVWSGQGFAALTDDPRWVRWNLDRSRARPPDGESMLEVQKRMVAGLHNLADRHMGEKIVAITHGDVVKAAVMWFLSMPVDNYDRFEISPASITELILSQDRGTLSYVNRTLTP